jgi:chromosome segregation ATPase
LKLNKRNKYIEEVSIMKRIMTLLLTVAFLAVPARAAFAEGTEVTKQKKAVVTEEQKQARQQYMTIHLELMNQLTELRIETRAAVEVNNSTAKTIKEKLKTKATVNKEKITELKGLETEAKTLIEQAKQIQQQRETVKTQYKEAVKARDLDKMKILQVQMTDLNSQFIDVKGKLEVIKAEAQPLKEEMTAFMENNKSVKENVKVELQQAKALSETISTQREEKAKLWEDFRENIKNKDYSSAENTLKNIIEKKAAILENIKKRGEVLAGILDSLS